jgi:23S rRNA (adenine2503-C2)-methyltransferase
MKVIAECGRDDIAKVYIAESENGFIEFVQSLEPPHPREKKWVFILSTLYGCPVKCRICDAGYDYKGKLGFDEIFFQINYLLKRFDADKFVCNKLKIQFARVGEPSFNMAVIDVIKEIPSRIKNHTVYPSISTVAPKSSSDFFDKLLTVKKKFFPKNFQLQFSIHSTDYSFRDYLIPIKKWDFKQISEYGKAFFNEGGRKITLNFVYNSLFPVDCDIIKKHFPKECFLIKVTPINPTFNAINEKLVDNFIYDKNVWFEKLRSYGYDVIVSIGELEENKIGSNCGQYITAIREKKVFLKESYTYDFKLIN